MKKFGLTLNVLLQKDFKEIEADCFEDAEDIAIDIFEKENMLDVNKEFTHARLQQEYV